MAKKKAEVVPPLKPELDFVVTVSGMDVVRALADRLRLWSDEQERWAARDKVLDALMVSRRLNVSERCEAIKLYEMAEDMADVPDDPNERVKSIVEFIKNVYA